MPANTPWRSGVDGAAALGSRAMVRGMLRWRKLLNEAARWRRVYNHLLRGFRLTSAILVLQWPISTPVRG
jgi:hypothetical protein